MRPGNNMKTLTLTLLTAIMLASTAYAAPNPPNPAVSQLKAITPYTSDWSRKFLTNVTSSEAIYFIMSDTNAVYSLVQAMGITNGDVNINMNTNYVYGELARQSNSIRIITNTFALTTTVSNNALVMSNRTQNITASQLYTNGLVDWDSVEFNGGGALTVRTNGIQTWHLNPENFALPIFGGGGTNKITLATNSISWAYLKTNLLYGAAVATNVAASDFFILGAQATGTAPGPNIAMKSVSWDTLRTVVTNIAGTLATNAVGSFQPTLLAVRANTSSVTNTPSGTNILRSRNVASVIHTNTSGFYTLVFSNAFANANYVVSVTPVGVSSANEQVQVGTITRTTNYLVLQTVDFGATSIDPGKELHVIIYP